MRSLPERGSSLNITQNSVIGKFLGRPVEPVDRRIQSVCASRIERERERMYRRFHDDPSAR